MLKYFDEQKSQNLSSDAKSENKMRQYVKYLKNVNNFQIYRVQIFSTVLMY